MKKYLIIPLILISSSLYSQTVYHHISNKSIYSFLDEMSNAQLIDLNSAVVPYSRKFIAEKLNALDRQRERLNFRQQKELDYFLKDFNKELKPDKNFKKRLDIFYYKDSLFTFSANLILGIQYWINSNGNVYHRWNGGEAFAYVGKHWGFYASLRDNHESETISEYNLLTQRMGGNYKGENDYSEMRGGLTYTWKWGTVGLLKDHNSWGNNYNGSNIQSGRTPSIAKITLQLKPVQWFEFNYFHGWLVSEEVDSSRSYWYQGNMGPDYKEVYHSKYMAANIFTFTPLQHFNISAGNSIIYTDIGIHPGYLIPIFFYKSVDHTVNSDIQNQNSQMFLDISSRQIKHLHLYGTLYIDELATSRMFNPDTSSNFFSWKLGGRISNYPFQNIIFTFEHTHSNPLSFRHMTPTITYESNKYNLGHYLTDNAREYYTALSYKPLRGLKIDLSYLFAQKGPDYTEQGDSRLGLPFMETIKWESNTLALKVCYQIINDGFVFAEYQYSNITGEVKKYTHPLWHGKSNTFSAGLNFGF